MPFLSRFCLLGVTALIVPGVAAAQDYRGVVMKQLDATVQSVSQHGFSIDQSAVSRDQVIGLLPAQSMMMLELSLTGGTSYFITGVCDQDCGDMDLELFEDQEFASVDKDEEDDDFPMLEFTAPRTGNYMLAVRMVKCETNNCYFGVRVYRK